MDHRKIILLALLAAALGVVAALLLRAPPISLAAGTVLPDPVPIGDFGLVDQRAERFGPAQLKDRWTLLFAGFTHCPDICPVTVAMLGRLGERLVASGHDLQIVFLTVDPARDTPEVLARYLGHFDGGLTGVTGSAAEVDRFATSLGLAHVRNPGTGGEYTVDHSTALMLLDPKARLAGYFQPPHDPEALAADLAALPDAG